MPSSKRAPDVIDPLLQAAFLKVARQYRRGGMSSSQRPEGWNRLQSNRTATATAGSAISLRRVAQQCLGDHAPGPGEKLFVDFAADTVPAPPT